MWKLLCESQAYVYRFSLLLPWHYKTSQSYSAIPTHLILIILFYSTAICIWSLKCKNATTLTLHKSQVHCFGDIQLGACSSLNPILYQQRQVAKLASELFYYWPLLRNNRVVTNLRRCISSHGSMRFAACRM